MIIQIFRTDDETIKRFGPFRWSEPPHEDTGKTRGIGFIFFFFGISVGFEYGD